MVSRAIACALILVPLLQPYVRNLTWAAGTTDGAPLLSSSPPAAFLESLFVRGKGFVPTGSSPSISDSIPLPHSGTRDVQWAAFTSIPELEMVGAQAPVFEINSNMQQGGSMRIVYKSTCTSGALASPPSGRLVDWMVVRSGIFSQLQPSGDFIYLAVGIVDVESSRPRLITLTHPTNSSISLFRSNPIIIVQVQDAATDRGIVDTVPRVVTIDSNTFNIELTAPHNSTPRSSKVAYLVMQAGSYMAVDHNTVLSAAFASLTGSDQYRVSSTASTSQCGRQITFVSPQSTTYPNSPAIVTLGKEDATTASASSLLTQLFVPKIIDCSVSPPSPSSTIQFGALTWIDQTMCVQKQHIPVADYNSSTIIWLSVLAVIGVALVGTLFYFLCRPKPEAIQEGLGEEDYGRRPYAPGVDNSPYGEGGFGVRQMGGRPLGGRGF